MTSPDRFLPDRAYQPQNISQLQHVTQESVALQQTADMRDMMGELFDTFFDNLFGGFGDVVSAIVSGINQFIHDLLMLLDGVTGGIFNIDNLAETFNSTRGIANNAENTANDAHTTATNAYNTANGLSTQVTAAQTAASNAANVAAIAEDKADAAIVGATWREKEFAISTAGTLNGRNEAPSGILMPTPPGYSQKVERVIYRSDTNVGGSCQVELIRKTSSGALSTIVTTSIPTNATLVPDSSPSYLLDDLDSLYCNVIGLTGTITGLTCTVETALVAIP